MYHALMERIENRTHKTLERYFPGIPEWFDSELIPLLEKKRDRSDMTLRERTLDWAVRQQLKALPTFMTKVVTKRMGWEDIEKTIEQTAARVVWDNYTPDIVLGIKSGGAFIAPYVTRCLEAPVCDYMHISHYSGDSRSVVKSARNVTKDAIVKEAPRVNIKGKRILLVDDQSGTGSTLRVGKEYLLENGAAEVKSFCLYSRFMEEDYVMHKGMMLYTPWGKDA